MESDREEKETVREMLGICNTAMLSLISNLLSIVYQSQVLAVPLVSLPGRPPYLGGARQEGTRAANLPSANRTRPHTPAPSRARPAQRDHLQQGPAHDDDEGREEVEVGLDLAGGVEFGHHVGPGHQAPGEAEERGQRHVEPAVVVGVVGDIKLLTCC